MGPKYFWNRNWNSTQLRIFWNCRKIPLKIIYMSSMKIQKELKSELPPLWSTITLGLSKFNRVTLWCYCSYADIGNSYLGNSTYMKVILTKNLTFIIIICHTKFQFANIFRTMKKNYFSEFLWFLCTKKWEKNQFFFIVPDIFANWNFVW